MFNGKKPMPIMHVNYFFVLLAMPSDDGQQWPERVTADFILNLLCLMPLAMHSCIKKCNSSGSLIKTFSSPHFPQHKFCTNFSSVPFVLHFLPISSFLIPLSLKIFVEKHKL
jgi:hypothetical protein